MPGPQSYTSELVSKHQVSGAAKPATILHLKHIEKNTHTSLQTHTHQCAGKLPAVNIHCLLFSFNILSSSFLVHTWLLCSAHHYGLFIVTSVLNGKYFELSVVVPVYFSTQQIKAFYLVSPKTGTKSYSLLKYKETKSWPFSFQPDELLLPKEACLIHFSRKHAALGIFSHTCDCKLYFKLFRIQHQTNGVTYEQAENGTNMTSLFP